MLITKCWVYTVITSTMLYYHHVDYLYRYNATTDKLTMVLFGDHHNAAPVPTDVYCTLKQTLPANITVSIQLFPALDKLTYR